MLVSYVDWSLIYYIVYSYDGFSLCLECDIFISGIRGFL